MREHRLADLVRQFRIFEDGAKNSRRKNTALWVKPARQRLEPDYPLRGKVDLGLVEGHDLAQVEGPANLIRKRDPLLHRIPEFAREAHDTRPAAVFRSIER